jgi:hypothetical protein
MLLTKEVFILSIADAEMPKVKGAVVVRSGEFGACHSSSMDSLDRHSAY